MGIPLLTTKLYIPPVRPELVSRPRLTERLNAGLHRKLTLVSAPAARCDAPPWTDAHLTLATALLDAGAN